MTANRPLKFVASGFPSPADDFSQQTLDLNKFLVKHPSATFFMRNQSSANRCYGIVEGDILMIDRSLKPSPQRLSVLVLDDEFRVRNYKELKKLLQNKQNSDAELWGVITAIIRKF